MLCRMGIVLEAPIPKHVTGIYVFTVVNLLAMLCIARVDAEITVKDLLSNETAARYLDMQAKFGPDFPSNGLQGRLLYAEPDPQACEAINPAPSVADKYPWILLIARGGSCQFSDKVLNAQFHNYSAVIVHNYEHKDGRLPMAGGNNGSRVTIPSTFVGWTDGMELRRLYDYSTHKEYIIKITEDESVDYSGYLWPFLLVMAVCIFVIMIFLLLKFLRDYASRRLSRLSNKHLKKIPVRKFKKGDYYDTCAICLEEYQEGEKIRVLPCDHVYHRKCIDPWLTKNKKTCPVCKRRVIPGRDADSESGSEGENGGIASGGSETTPLLRDTSAGLTLYTNGPTVPADSHIGAVGSAGISDRARHQASQAQCGTARGNIQDSGERREVRLERKRRKQDRERRTGGEEEPAVTREEEDEAGTSTVSETRVRRERRKRRRDRRQGDRPDMGHETRGERDKNTAEGNVHKGELESSSGVREVSAEEARAGVTEVSAERARAGVTEVSAEEARAGVREVSAERAMPGGEDGHGSCVNPGFLRNEIVMPLTANRRDLNEAV